MALESSRRKGYMCGNFNTTNKGGTNLMYLISHKLVQDLLVDLEIYELQVESYGTLRG